MVSDVSVTCLSIPFTIRTQETVQSRKQGFDHDFNTVTFLMGGRPSHPRPDRFSCFRESTLSLGMLLRVEVRCTLDRFFISSGPSSSSVMKNCLFNNLWLLSLPTKLLPSGLPVASLHPQPYSFLSKHHTFLTSLLLGCLCTTLGRRRTSQHQPGAGPHLSGSMLLTFTNAFEVFTSSAFSVKSSGLSLAITSEPLPELSASELEVFPFPGVPLQHPGSAQAVRGAFSALFTQILHFNLQEAISIFLLIRQQFQRIDQICAEALRYCMRFEDLGLLNIVTCLYDQKPVRLLPVALFSTNCAPPFCGFSPRDPPNVVFQRETVAVRAQVRLLPVSRLAR